MVDGHVQGDLLLSTATFRRARRTKDAVDKLRVVAGHTARRRRKMEPLPGVCRAAGRLELEDARVVVVPHTALEGRRRDVPAPAEEAPGSDLRAMTSKTETMADWFSARVRPVVAGQIGELARRVHVAADGGAALCLCLLDDGGGEEERCAYEYSRRRHVATRSHRKFSVQTVTLQACDSVQQAGR